MIEENPLATDAQDKVNYHLPQQQQQHLDSSIGVKVLDFGKLVCPDLSTDVLEQTENIVFNEEDLFHKPSKGKRNGSTDLGFRSNKILLKTNP